MKEIELSSGKAIIESEIGTTSGFSAIDAVAMSLVDLMRLRPAMNRDKRVSVWVELPLTFQVREIPDSS